MNDDYTLEPRGLPRREVDKLEFVLDLGRMRPKEDELKPRWIAGPPEDGDRP